MANDKVCPETAPASNERKSRIRMGIQRTLSTAAYETVVIHYEIDEEVSWPNDKGGLVVRQQKVKNWETVLTQEFKAAHDRILEELNLSHKKAYFKNKQVKGNQEDMNDLDELDELD